MTDLVKSIHVLMGAILLGLKLVEFFYITHSFKQSQTRLIRLALQMSFYNDIILAILIILLFLSGHYLVNANHFLITTPWIKMANVALSVLGLGWLSQIGIKFFNYQHIYAEQPAFHWRNAYYILQVLIIALGILLIHDAVMQQTFTWFH